MPRTSYYALTRSLDPMTGQPRVEGGAWVPGSPMAEVIVRCLRTPLGAFKPDRTFGVDFSLVHKGAPNAAATFKAALEEALKRYTQNTHIQDLTIEVERRGANLFYEITFIDPRVRPVCRHRPIRGRL